MELLDFDHVQLAMPAGEESRARAFYGELLGLAEVPKPEPLRARGGAWFGSGALRLHLGVEPGFRPARKAHPAIRVRGLADLRERALAAGLAPSEIQDLEGTERMFLDDPFGNRIEFVGAG